MPNEPRHRWAALAVLLVAEAMNLLDTTIVQVAAPAIHAELGGAAATISWYSAASTLPFALLLVTGGRLGDIVGRRRVFRLGVAAFTLASAVWAATAVTAFGMTRVRVSAEGRVSRTAAS
ncbi:MFS transporter [Amycolatopsis sp. NPDC004368]